MSKPVVSVRPKMAMRYFAWLFEKFDLHHARVIEENKILGLVSYKTMILNGLK